MHVQAINRAFLPLPVSLLFPPWAVRPHPSSKRHQHSSHPPNKSKPPAVNAVFTIPYSTDNVTLFTNMIFTEVEQNTLYNLFFFDYIQIKNIIEWQERKGCKQNNIMPSNTVQTACMNSFKWNLAGVTLFFFSCGKWRVVKSHALIGLSMPQLCNFVLIIFFSFTINQQDHFLFTVVGNAFVMPNVILTEKYNNQIYKVYSHLKSKTIETVQF